MWHWIQPLPFFKPCERRSHVISLLIVRTHLLILIVVSGLSVLSRPSLLLSVWTLMTLMYLTCVLSSPGAFKPARLSFWCWTAVSEGVHSVARSPCWTMVVWSFNLVPSLLLHICWPVWLRMVQNCTPIVWHLGPGPWQCSLTLLHWLRTCPRVSPYTNPDSRSIPMLSPIVITRTSSSVFVGNSPWNRGFNVTKLFVPSQHACEIIHTSYRLIMFASSFYSLAVCFCLYNCISARAHPTSLTWQKRWNRDWSGEADVQIAALGWGLMDPPVPYISDIYVCWARYHKKSCLVQPLNSFFSVFPVWTGESGRIQETSGAFFIWTVEIVAAAGGWISPEIFAAQRLEKLPEKQRHMNSQELFLIRGAIWCICKITPTVRQKKSTFPSKTEPTWRTLTIQTGGWAHLQMFTISF